MQNAENTPAYGLSERVISGSFLVKISKRLFSRRLIAGKQFFALGCNAVHHGGIMLAEHMTVFAGLRAFLPL